MLKTYSWWLKPLGTGKSFLVLWCQKWQHVICCLCLRYRVNKAWLSFIHAKSTGCTYVPLETTNIFSWGGSKGSARSQPSTTMNFAVVSREHHLHCYVSHILLIKDVKICWITWWQLLDIDMLPHRWYAHQIIQYQYSTSQIKHTMIIFDGSDQIRYHHPSRVGGVIVGSYCPRRLELFRTYRQTRNDVMIAVNFYGVNSDNDIM